MAAEQSIPRMSFRIFFRRNQIWFSELVGVLIVSIILIALGSFGIALMAKQNTIRANAQKLARLKADRIVFSGTLAQWQDKDIISATLTEFVKGRVSRQSINLLVQQVYQSSRTYGYDPLLVLAVIHVESVFDADALGRYRDGNFSGAIGLMQLKFETAQEVAKDLGISLESVEELHIPEINIALGVAYLTQVIAQFHSLKLGILAYNQGPGVILESISGKRPLSVRYYNKVLKSYYKLKDMHRKRRSPTS